MGERVDRWLAERHLTGAHTLQPSRPLVARTAFEGVWVAAPYIGRGEIGAAWAELFVTTRAGARWLDDDLPHAAFADGAAPKDEIRPLTRSRLARAAEGA